MDARLLVALKFSLLIFLGLLVFLAGPGRTFVFAQAPKSQPNAQAQNPGGLKITDILFEDVNGDVSSHWQMKPGGDVVVSFRVDGFTREPVEADDGLKVQRVKLHYDVALTDSAGNAVVPPYEEDLDTTLGQRDEKWRPKVNWTATVPAGAGSGEYRIEIRVNDLIAQRDVSKTAPFRVSGDAVSDEPSIHVEQLQYSNSERGPWTPERYFPPSDTILVQYKVAGYDVSPEHQVWVEQDWQILDADGKVIAQQPNAVVENSSNFYPPRFLFTTFSLKLERPKPGQYTLRIDIRDRVGEQASSLDSIFFIRQ